MTDRALILVDIQNDFCPGGALPAPEGDAVVPIANRLQGAFSLVVATQDWHPPDHLSFASNHPDHEVGDVIQLNGLEQILWPDHCVQETPGAEFVSELDLAPVATIFRKGIDREIDSYSGFYDNGHRRATGLNDFLQEKNVKQVFIAGLATDFCVKFTTLDAIELGFETYVVTDACRGVNREPEDSVKALEKMREEGARLVSSDMLTL